MNTKKKRIFQIITQTQFLGEDKIIKTLSNDKVLDYAYILHNKDRYSIDEYNEYIRTHNEKPNYNAGDIKPSHWHIFVRYKYGRTFESVAKDFGIDIQRVRKVDNTRGTLEYLIHLNNKEKYQYEIDNVKANFDYRSTILSTQPLSKDRRLLEINNYIASGKLNEYNISTCGLIDSIEYMTYLPEIKKLFEFYRKQLKEKYNTEGRNMKVIYIQGDKGTGKTSYAKELAKKKGLSFFVSSSSNDILDGYEGQQCVILDDLRSTGMQFADLLKLLDNNTSSSFKSRYYNKTLFCELIIITTVKDIDTFYQNVFLDDEPKGQFFRRCENLMKMDSDKILLYSYNKDTNKYDYIETIKNPISEKYQTKAESIEDRKANMMELLEISEDDIIKDDLPF